MCRKYFHDGNYTFSRRRYPKMYSSDKQRFLYCIVPKVKRHLPFYYFYFLPLFRTAIVCCEAVQSVILAIAWFLDEIFAFEKYLDLVTRVSGHSRLLKMTPFDRSHYGRNLYGVVVRVVITVFGIGMRGLKEIPV